ncbi:hypothetical protein CBR_g108 [Chara braunii]|uniref:Uncharacterized protein n=1 Tax=Chara braunii TaxID=69332 RepID=A0A388JLM4_CHABU|nr:hypothetical protein CBR_g108 [Chara braunii]|eukprot:GBG58707.1 hypothetical protein CBR_g108 [Chara braunii]
MSGPFPVQAGTQPSGTSAAAAQTVTSSSSGPAAGATPQPQQTVPPHAQQQGQWYPKTPMKPPLAFSGEKKDEELNTWLRTVPVWVRAKRTSQEEEVITVPSYLEGKAAKWMDGLVAKAGLGRRMADWGKTLTLEEFFDMVEARWHNPQQAQIVTDAMLRLDQRKYKSVRELTSTVESLIVVLGIRYDDQVLLTTFLRCLSENLINLLASEARLEYHSFETFSRKALDLEATLGIAQPTPVDRRKKKSPQEWKKKGSRLMMVESDGTQTQIDELSDLMDSPEYDGEETVEGSTLAAVVKTKASGRGKGHQKSQGQTASNQSKVADWVKACLDQEVRRDRRVRGACINYGEYDHTQYKCKNAKCHQPQEGDDKVLKVNDSDLRKRREDIHSSGGDNQDNVDDDWNNDDVNDLDDDTGDMNRWNQKTGDGDNDGDSECLESVESPQNDDDDDDDDEEEEEEEDSGDMNHWNQKTGDGEREGDNTGLGYTVHCDKKTSEDRRVYFKDSNDMRRSEQKDGEDNSVEKARRVMVVRTMV